jgi:hypothetical protein
MGRKSGGIVIFSPPDNTSEPMKIFIGSLASATARPQRSEESQAGGRPRPALEGTRGESSHGLAGITR